MSGSGGRSLGDRRACPEERHGIRRSKDAGHDYQRPESDQHAGLDPASCRRVDAVPTRNLRDRPRRISVLAGEPGEVEVRTLERHDGLRRRGLGRRELDGRELDARHQPDDRRELDDRRGLDGRYGFDDWQNGGDGRLLDGRRLAEPGKTIRNRP
jgi:hypothetical protein